MSLATSGASTPDDASIHPGDTAPAATATTAACSHCGLPSPPPDPKTGLTFCCHGCHGAHELIHRWGLEEYYALRDVQSSETAIGDAQVSFDDLDDPALLGRSAPVPLKSADGTVCLRTKLAIKGLHCAACVWLIEQTPDRVAGIQSASVNYHSRILDVVFDPKTIKLSAVGGFLHRLGYAVGPLSDGDEEDGDPEMRSMLVDIAIAGFCAANAMWVAIALYAGHYSGIAGEHAALLRAAGVLLGCIAVLFPGRVFFRSAMASLRTRVPHMDLPVALGLSAGLLASLYGLLDVQREIYFDSIASLVFFLLTGRYIQARQQRRAGDMVASLVHLSPLAANRVQTDGQVQRVPVGRLQVGDLVSIDAGESIPIDGIIHSGDSLIDRSLLTGESRPIPVDIGDSVEAGTDNLQSTIVVNVTAVASDTRLASIRDAVAGAASSRTPIIQLANRVGGWFVIVVLFLSVITLAIWSLNDPSQAIPNTVALLIVACPCALALATPLAVAVAIGRLAKHRILVRQGDCLERIPARATIFFDKTGTLTAGQMRVTEIRGDQSILPIVAAIESQTRHPIGDAIGRAASKQNRSVDAIVATAVRQFQGQGITGVVDALQYRIGNEAFMTVTDDASLVEWKRQIASMKQATSTVYVQRSGVIVAVIGIADPLRDDAPEVIATFRKLGWQIGLLSGDDRRSVDRVAVKLGLSSDEASGELLPQQKLSEIQHAKQHGVVVMVGDGLNDAAALAAADIGIAIRGGASASLDAAPVLIGDDRLGGVVDFVAAAKSTQRSIRRNFAVSIGYNLFAVSLAMTGTISPLIAAVLMPISSISVIAMTLAGRTIRTEDRVCDHIVDAGV